SHQIGFDAKIFLRAAESKAEPKKYFVEDQHNGAGRTDFPQILQPSRVGDSVETRGSVARDQRRIARRSSVGIQSLNRIDENTGDIVARSKDAQGSRVHFLERVGLARRPGIADPRLNPIPPTMIRTAEPDDV